MHNARSIMVCVTQQKNCERLILSGYNLLKNKEDKLYIINVVNEKDHFLNNKNDGEALEYLFKVSKEAGADLTVIRASDVVKAMANFAKDKKITNVIMGSSPVGNSIEDHTIANKLISHLPKTSIQII